MDQCNMIKKLLIANRGEIACRIIRTAKRLGITTVAVYSSADKNDYHCQIADSAYYIGPVPVENSYLNIEHMIQAAKDCGCDAIHPGYGFLSENPNFAKACQDNGLIFVGPDANAIAKMAVKDDAKKIMAKANVPVVPGFEGNVQNDQAFLDAALKIGFPLILKAAKGGGGKGMRVVTQQKDFLTLLHSARRESLASFNDESIFIEKYLHHARHIEVQIFRDKHGHTVHLFERDCSLQRRHQKIIESAPALGIPPEVKEQLYQAAIRAAQAIDYVGAGTVEFLVTQDFQFYFMEMNTRLQVEHPVTEMITGFDLVEWQLRIASNEPLLLTQAQITHFGFAFEARIYAEDPYHDFLPATGVIKKIILPSSGVAYRLDSGLQVGDKIGIYFDPLLAKIIVHAATREKATIHLASVLSQIHLVGITTNLPFLRKIVQDPSFQNNELDTQFVEADLSRLLPKEVHSKESLALAGLVYLLHRKAKANPSSPWEQVNAWRLNLPFQESLTLQQDHDEYTLIISHPHTANAEDYQICCQKGDLNVLIGGKIQIDKIQYHFPNHQGILDYYCDEEIIELFHEGSRFTFTIPSSQLHEIEHQTSSEHALVSPMPGIISRIWVKSGDSVEKGTKLLALEAMKMEHTLWAPFDGIIKNLFYQMGDQVEAGCELLDFE